MCKFLKLALPVLLVGLVVVAFGSTPARANCDIGVPISAGQDGAPINLGTCSQNPQRAYWLVEHGNPAVGLGVDNGSASIPLFENALGGGILTSDWNDSPVDGCPVDFLQSDGTFAPMALLISGENNPGPYPGRSSAVAALSTDYYEPFQSGYSFDEVAGDQINGFPPGAAISCQLLGSPTVVPMGGGSYQVSWGGVASQDDCAFNGDSIDEATDCIGGSRNLLTGWHAYYAHADCVLGTMTADRAAWTQTGGLLPAGANAGTMVTAPDAPAGKCLFLAYNPVWDSGFEGKYVSDPSDKLGGAGNSDGDTWPDNSDNCPMVANEDQADADGDLIGDACDNCDGVINYDQADSNSNGVGDACDNCPTTGDSDGDGACDDVDNCPTVPNATQVDADSDGLGDACDTCPLDPANDADGDGVCGNVDNCPGGGNPNQADIDGDGMGDACDPCPYEAADPNQSTPDKDGDGICSCDAALFNADLCPTSMTFDNCPRVSNANQIPSGWGDGLGTACEDKFAAVQVLPTHDKGFGDCILRFKTNNEWNCPKFTAAYHGSTTRPTTINIPCRICTRGTGQNAVFYGGTRATGYVKYCHGGHNMFVQAVRSNPNACGLLLPKSVTAVRIEKLATRTR